MASPKPRIQPERNSVETDYWIWYAPLRTGHPKRWGRDSPRRSERFAKGKRRRTIRRSSSCKEAIPRGPRHRVDQRQSVCRIADDDDFGVLVRQDRAITFRPCFGLVLGNLP